MSDQQGKSPERQAIETEVVSRLTFSRRFRRAMGAISLGAGLWLGTQTVMDFSGSPQNGESVQEADSSSDFDKSDTVASILLLTASGAAVGEKLRSNRRINQLVDGYGEARGSRGFDTTSLVMDSEAGFSEVNIHHASTLNKDVNSFIDPLASGLKTVGLGLGAVASGQIIQSFTSSENYTDPLMHQITAGGSLAICGGLLMVGSVIKFEQNKWESVVERLDNIDNTLRFE